MFVEKTLQILRYFSSKNVALKFFLDFIQLPRFIEIIVPKGNFLRHRACMDIVRPVL